MTSIQGNADSIAMADEMDARNCSSDSFSSEWNSGSKVGSRSCTLMFDSCSKVGS